MLPNFLVIGAPRAGTTWITTMLKAHPDIYMSSVKELHFFDKHYDKSIAYYEQFFGDWVNEKAIGEATPAYLCSERVPLLIKKHLPDVKLIVSLRNPVDRLYSRYWNAKAKFPSNRDLSFEDKIKRKPLFIEEGFYYDHLLRYYQHFPEDRIQVLLFDDLKKNPREFVRGIYGFLGVDSTIVPPLLDQPINAASGKKMLGKSRLLWYLYKGLVGMKIIRLAHTLKNLNKKQLPPMKTETREWLVNDVYLNKNKLLEELIGRDLSHWK